MTYVCAANYDLLAAVETSDPALLRARPALLRARQMTTRVKDAGEFFEAEIATFNRFWQFQFLARSSRAFKPVTLVRRVPKMWILLSSGRVSILFLIGRKTIKHFTSIRLA
jgi:hypothetical protein